MAKAKTVLILLAVLDGIGWLLWAFSGFFDNHHHPRLSDSCFWLFVGTIVVLAATSSYRLWVAPTDTNLLLPANDPDPPCLENALRSLESYGIPTEERRSELAAPNVLKLFFGTNTCWTTKDSQAILSISRMVLLSIHRDCGIAVDLKIFGADRRIIAQLERNKLHINQNNSFRVDRPDPHTLIVYDQMAETVLHVRFLNPKSFHIVSGTFRYADRPPVRVTEQRVILENNNQTGGNIVGSVDGLGSGACFNYY